MINHTGTIELNTDKFNLRKFLKDDAQNVYDNITSNENIAKYLTWQKHASFKQTEELLDNWSSHYNNRTYRWAICDKANNEVIGSIQVGNAGFNFHCVEIAFVIAENYWNQGNMTEILTQIIKHMFDLGCHRIEAKHHIDNLASAKVMKKIGMKNEGVLKDYAVKDGQYIDYSVWAIVNEQNN